MTDNAMITGNISDEGGALGIIGGKVTMRDESSITNNTSVLESERRGGGGVVIANNGMLTMQGNSSISGNKAVNGGGVAINSGTLVMEDNSTIRNNEANVGTNSMLYGGGGIYISLNGSAELKGNSLVTGNKAVYGGGVFTKLSALTFEGGELLGGTNRHTFETGNIRGNFAENGPDIFENYQ
jgi:hypothetical protein